ncbi:Zinc finger, C2H2 type family protein [Trichomonas vaginalis G3]|uniref:Zinc finger, C2H2 type family protein n=1 Tax=Trichomonas vaginalis (strain ATCC PRA-98 / G3) TaxID=412133 RepID=A2DWN1_TRIV3|nr:3'-5' exonuclease protein [Trichomonas vaginalis G3]EAY15216.1 Zinc finger, C2H2 type family protein [Trichomonas vaginalis G3]KAI5550630.1 3'-5' exonuclease protein [Trichomonas vaginalis G3]|eukprot:XP_001327439.1 Zinc finger, C2H2 type family protein [Trichomonas vaginalis G3]
MNDTITFTPEIKDLAPFSTIPWNEGEIKKVEFFNEKFVSVQVISIDNPKLEETLNGIIDGKDISVDFEWKPDVPGEDHPFALFQFCTSKGAVIVMNNTDQKNDIIEKFFTENQFFGKGMHSDNKKLMKMFDTTFGIQDVQMTYLEPYQISINFQLMVEELIGSPKALFKDKNISRSDWTVRPLTIKQCLYAVFDVYALYLCYSKLLEIYHKPGVIIKAPEMKTVKGKVQKEKCVIETPVKNIHVRFDTDVPYRGPEIFKEIMDYKNVCKLQDEYGPKFTLINHLTATGHLKGHYCVDCQQSYDDILKHCWVNHCGCISHIYFPIQTPGFLYKIAQEIELSNRKIKVNDDGTATCGICGKVCQRIHMAYSHIRLDHLPLSKDIVPSFVKDLSFGRRLIERRVLLDPPRCNFCDMNFDTVEELKEHHWLEHGQIIAQMWKHRPGCYDDDTFLNSFDLGVKAVNETIYGIMIEGILCCWDCRIGFDSPEELFVHLFHRHAFLCVLNKSDINQNYPFLLPKLPSEFLSTLERFCGDNARVECIVARIFSEKEDYLHCDECNVDMKTKDEVWEHMRDNHLILTFKRGKPVVIED